MGLDVSLATLPISIYHLRRDANVRLPSFRGPRSGAGFPCVLGLQATYLAYEESAPALRSAIWAGFALPRDAGRRPALRGVVRDQEGCAFRPPLADGAGVNTGGPSRRRHLRWLT